MAKESEKGQTRERGTRSEEQQREKGRSKSSHKFVTKLLYSGYFSGGKIFVVERRTMKFLPMKQYCLVPGCGLVYRDH